MKTLTIQNTYYVGTRGDLHTDCILEYYRYEYWSVTY